MLLKEKEGFGEDEDEPVLTLKTTNPRATRKKNLRVEKIETKGHKFWPNPKETELPHLQHSYFSREGLVPVDSLVT